jgi:hypothetical protein
VNKTALAVMVLGERESWVKLRVMRLEKLKLWLRGAVVLYSIFYIIVVANHLLSIFWLFSSYHSYPSACLSC